IKPGLGSAYEFTKGSFHINYDGYQSFTAKKGNVDADGMMKGDVDVDEADAGSGAPIALILVFAAPRIELNIGVSKVLPFDGLSEGAEKADKAFDFLVSKTFGAEALAKFKSSPMSKFSGKNIVDAAMGSNAAAYMELITTNGMSHSGSMVLSPCSRADLHFVAKVGATANGFGQSMGDVSKEIFKKDLTRVRPSANDLCNSL
ncbi:MAG: hypothetical protein ABIZ36_02565, partial [Gemmatimonadaceae bacterium]